MHQRGPDMEEGVEYMKGWIQIQVCSRTSNSCRDLCGKGASEAELGPPGRQRPARRVIRGPDPDLTTQQTAASQPCSINRDANQRGSIETRS